MKCTFFPPGKHVHITNKKNHNVQRQTPMFGYDHKDILVSKPKTRLLHAEWKQRTDKRHAVDAWKFTGR